MSACICGDNRIKRLLTLLYKSNGERRRRRRRRRRGRSDGEEEGQENEIESDLKGYSPHSSEKKSRDIESLVVI